MTVILIRQGNITEAEAEAIVNAGNTSLWLGSGVAGAIRSDCGDEVVRELEGISKLRSPKRSVAYTGGVVGIPVKHNLDFPCEYGEVVVTHAGKLSRRSRSPIRFVFHAAVMDCKGPYKGHTDHNIIFESTKNCILKAVSLHVRKIAFPIFGTGVGGIGIRESTTTMLRAIHSYPVDDLRILLYGYDGEACKQIREAKEEWDKCQV